MLCSLCQNGVTTKIGETPTGEVWYCSCGESHCRHLFKCQCGAKRPVAPHKDDYIDLGNERHTAVDRAFGMVKPDVWLIEDIHGEDFRVSRAPQFDNETRRAWRLA